MHPVWLPVSVPVLVLDEWMDSISALPSIEHRWMDRRSKVDRVARQVMPKYFFSRKHIIASWQWCVLYYICLQSQFNMWICHTN
jgi:hypothetical protein